MKTEEILQSIIARFQKGNIPRDLSEITFPKFNAPCVKWSWGNKLILQMSGHTDARGYVAWKSVGRYVKKGGHADVIILSPITRYIARKEKLSTGEEVEVTLKIVTGFSPMALFSKEMTEGKELDYEKIEVPQNLPLLEKALEWGITVKGTSSKEEELGTYSPAREVIKIVPTDKEEVNDLTFLHELSHAAHKKVKGELKGGQDVYQECVAELAAQTLLYILSPEKASKTEYRAFDYIQSYASSSNKSIGVLCLEVVKEVGQVIDLLLERKKDELL